MTNKKKRMSSVRGFMKNSLHKRNALVDELVRQVNELEEDLNLEYWAEEPDEETICELEMKLSGIERLLEKTRLTSIVLNGLEWSTLLERHQFGDFDTCYYLDGVAVDIAHGNELNPNQKYRLGWWIGGEMMLFPLMPSGRKRRPVVTIDRDDKSMYPCLKKAIVSEPSAAKNPTDSRFLWDRNERRGD